MAATCPGCGKATSESKATCYFCGTFLRPPVKCAKCGRLVPQTRSTCQYCGEKVAPEDATTAASAVGAPLAALVPLPRPPVEARPDAIAVPTFDLTDRSSGFLGWCRQHEEQIDLVLFGLALPIAVLALFTQLLVTLLTRMRRAGR